MMKFELALACLKAGSRIQRSDWNGRGMWLQLILAGGWTLWDTATKEPLPPPAAKQLPWIAMKTADDGFVPWLASQTDILAEDWDTVTEGNS